MLISCRTKTQCQPRASSAKPWKSMKKQLLIVTDLGSFKAYTVDNSRLNTTPRLELIEHFIPPEPHRKIADNLSDLAGRYRSAGAKGGATFGERHNIELEERKRLIRQLAKRLNRLMDDAEVDYCYLAAGKEINQQVLAALSPAAQARVKKNMPADLIKASKGKLLDYFGLRREKRPVLTPRLAKGAIPQFRPVL